MQQGTAKDVNSMVFMGVEHVGTDGLIMRDRKDFDISFCPFVGVIFTPKKQVNIDDIINPYKEKV